MAEEDILFGKKRHFFGGIEPSNMKLFEAEEIMVDGRKRVKLNIVLPDDTIIDGQTVCTVAGAVIRGGEYYNGYPKDEFDGYFVADVTKSGSIIDTKGFDLLTAPERFYSAFPYTTQGVYNRNESNRTAINVPFIVGQISYTVDTNGLQITITIQGDEYDGYEIRKSSTGYPKDENDGTLLSTTSHEGSVSYSTYTYRDSDFINGISYYYSVFPYKLYTEDMPPYNTNKIYTRVAIFDIGVNDSGLTIYNAPNKIKIKTRSYDYLCGFDLNTNDPNPNTRVSYPEDVDNHGFKPAKMRFNSGKFDYGSWAFKDPSYGNQLVYIDRFMPRPCMLNYDGTVAYYLKESDYTLRDTPAGSSSDISNISFKGNAMMEWPKVYTKRWIDNDGIYHFRCSDTAIDNTWKCWCNYDNDGTTIREVDHFYTSIFNASYNDGKLRSISGTTTAVNYSLSNCMDYADNNGTGWNVDRFVDRMLINDLLILMAKTTDLQSAYGNGYAKGSSSNALKTGTLNSKGLFWGSNDDSHAVKVFGMENYWGNVSRHIAGWLMVNGVQKIQDDGTFNTDGTNYRTLYTGSVSGTYGYISGMEVLDCGRIPYYASGSSSTYECDKMNVINSSSGTYTATVGGDYEDTSEAGPFAVDIVNSPTSSTTAPIGSGLSYKPTAS